ncbi:hypothetical protein [Burkholderia gladioli]|uniref:hypothetical protein n=1 Tax=Burkholderia gladioli TaxID=28095 RepID=UPI0016409C80|nr:hypothetical protein [Burkholderia gladioli]
MNGMDSSAQFASDIREYVSRVLLTDNIIELAFRAGLDNSDVIDALQPLLTRRMPHRVQTLLYCALPDPRRCLAFLAALSGKLPGMDRWNSSELRECVLDIGNRLDIEPRVAEYVCECWMLFGPSPLDLFGSMEVLGRELTCERCASAMETMRNSLMVA